jgi:hypothetical protein
MDPRDFIGLAREISDNINLISPKFMEAAYRTSISRLYYGLLHWMQQRLGITVPRTKVKVYHSHVITQLEDLLDDEILVDLHFLMKSRVEADYFLSTSVGIKSFKECSDSTDRVLANIDGGTSHAAGEIDDVEYYRQLREAKGGDARPSRSNPPRKKHKE